MTSNVHCSGGGVRVGTIPVLPPPIYLHFKNHCILCLQPQAHKLLQIVRENPKDLKNFRPIIHYLTGTDPSHDRGRVECELVGIPMMESLPPMCPSCYDILAELYRLHEQLLNVQLMIQKQTELAREVVAKGLRIPPYSVTSASTPTPRQKFHDKIQSNPKISLMSPMDSKRVISFVDNLHNKMVAEALSRKKVVFPTLETLQPRSSNQAPVHAPPPEVFMPDPLADDPVLMGPSSSFKESFTASSHVAPTQTLTSPPNTLLHAGQTSTPSETYYGYRPENHQPTEESESEDLKYEVEGSEFGNDDGDIDFKPEVSDCDEDVKDNELYMSSEASSPSPTSPSTSDKHLSSASGKRSIELKTSSPTKKKKRACRRGVRTSTPIPHTRPLVKSEEGVSQHCDICAELVHSTEIENHLITKHNLQGYIVKCPNPSCPSVFSCLGKLERHLMADGVKKNKCFRAARSYPHGAIYSRKCEVCNFKTDHVSDFRWHLKKHETEMTMSPRLACPITGCLERFFALRQSVEEHLSMRHKNEKSKLYTVKMDLVNGVRVFRVQKCDLCEKWILFTDIIQHLEGHNVKEYITKCPNPECEHVFSCVGQMKNHLLAPTSRCREKNEPLGTLKCNACDFEVAAPLSFRRHLLVHENREEKVIICPIAGCTERFALKQSVEDHLMSHGYRHRNKMKTFSERKEQKCPVCEEVIKIEELAKHYAEVHKMDQITKCSYCPFLFPNWESFLKHLYEHRSMTKDGLSCHICNDSKIKFCQFESLCHHLFNVHQLGKQYLCEHCDSEFFFHQSLTTHIQRAHSNEKSKPKQKKKQYKCDMCPDVAIGGPNTLHAHKMKVHGGPPASCRFCPETFVSLNLHRKHEAAHTGLKRSYKCRVEGCPKVYPNMYKCRIHMTNAHNLNPGAPKVPGLVCDICGLSLASNRSLRNHQLIHSGERPHTCSICGHGFRTRSVLGTHLKAHQEKGESFKPSGPMTKGRKRVGKTNE